MTNPRKGLASAKATAIKRRPSRAVRLLKLSIEEQIDTLILSAPDFDIKASQEVDALLLFSESLGAEF